MSRRTEFPAALALTGAACRRQTALNNLAFALVVAAGAFLVVGLMPNLAWAQTQTSAITKVICEVVNLFTGGIGVLMGVIAICIVGLTAALGRISWPTALTTVVGIALIFGASSLIGIFGGKNSCSGITSTIDAKALRDALCQIFTLLQGTVGASLATIAVCMLGFGALLGKVQWTTALTVIIGLIVLFSAASTLQVLYSANGTLKTLPGDTVSSFLGGKCVKGGIDFGYFSQSMCTIAAFISGKKGTVASIIAVMAVWIVSFSAMYGKVSWSAAMTLAVGIALVFGSATVVGYVSGRNIACKIYDSGQTAGETLKLSIRTDRASAKCADPITGDVVDCSAITW